MAAIREMTMHDILIGDEVGLLSRCRDLVEFEYGAGKCAEQSKQMMLDSISLFERRCTGELPTDASFLRKLVADHADYQRDSVLTRGSIPRDLLKLAAALGGCGTPAEEIELFLRDCFPVAACGGKHLISEVHLVFLISCWGRPPIAPGASLQCIVRARERSSRFRSRVAALRHASPYVQLVTRIEVNSPPRKGYAREVD